MKKIKLKFPNLNIKQTGIWLVVLFLGITGFVFLIDQTPAPMNQSFNTYELIQPDFDYGYQTQVYGIPTYTAKQDFYQEAGVPQTGYETVYSATELEGLSVGINDEDYGLIVESYDHPNSVYLLDQLSTVSFMYDGQNRWNISPAP